MLIGRVPRGIQGTQSILSLAMVRQVQLFQLKWWTDEAIRQYAELSYSRPSHCPAQWSFKSRLCNGFVGYVVLQRNAATLRLVVTHLK